MAAQQLFGIVAAGLSVLTQPTEMPSPTSYIYSIPTAAKSFSHVVVFLLPGVILPENSAAAIYLITPGPGQAGPSTKFLGGIGPGKESAIFKLSASESGQNVVLGLSIEDAGSVASRITDMAATKSAGSTSQSLALVPAGAPGSRGPTTLVLAQRIIKNCFDFLASFSGQAGQVEVVPLKAFENWWQKFESRIRSDPGFLEREEN